jgi:hypothetical protein
VVAAAFSVILSCLQISSCKNPFLRWDIHRTEFGTFDFKGRQSELWGNSRSIDCEQGDGGWVWWCWLYSWYSRTSNSADCMTWYIQVKMSANCNTGAVRLLYQHYAHIAWKHNCIYNSVYFKHGGWQFQELLYILSHCWFPAPNKAVPPCDLSIIFIHLLLEHRV